MSPTICDVSMIFHHILWWPPDILVGILRFYHDSFFLSLFLLFRQLRSELAEWNSTISSHMVRSNCNLKIHVQSMGYPLPLPIGPKNHLFRPFCNLTATVMAYIIRMKQDIDNWASVLQTPKVSHVVQNDMNFGPQTAWNWTRVFTHPPKIRRFLHCRASHMHFRPQNLTKLCHMIGL